MESGEERVHPGPHGANMGELVSMSSLFPATRLRSDLPPCVGHSLP